MQRKKNATTKEENYEYIATKKNRSEFIIFRQNEFAHLIKLG